MIVPRRSLTASRAGPVRSRALTITCPADPHRPEGEPMQPHHDRRPAGCPRPATAAVHPAAVHPAAGSAAVHPPAAPASASAVVTLSNWAYANGYRLRAKGMSHNWSPIVLPAGSSGAGYVLVDTTQGLTSISVSAGSPATATAGAGATMDTLTSTLA